MIIDAISDLHGYLPRLTGGDLLVVAGDITAADRVKQWMEFFDWLKAQDYKKKVLVGGNHDGFLESCISTDEARSMGIEDDASIEYLCDSGVEFEGFKIWGSPWTPRFCNWHFMLTRGERMREKWALIPDDTDILVTHGPPHGILDRSARGQNRNKHVGCIDLRNRVMKVKPKLHIFGHIHEWGGQVFDAVTTKFVNCSLLDEHYDWAHEPVRIEI